MGTARVSDCIHSGNIHHTGQRSGNDVSIIPAIAVIFVRKYLDESDVWIQNKDKYVNKNILKEFRELIRKDHRKIFIISLIVFAIIVFDIYVLFLLIRYRTLK